MRTNYVRAIYNALQYNVNHHFSLIHRAYGRFYAVIQNSTYGKRLFLLPFFAYTQSLWQILCRDSEFNLWETAVFTAVFCLYTEPMANSMP